MESGQNMTQPPFHANFAIPSKTIETPAHRENIPPKGDLPYEALIMVHEPIAIKDAIKIPDAKKALDVEWTKLNKQRVWELETVREYSEVKSLALQEGRVVNFGRVYPLCFMKHAEQSLENWKLKGRVVFQGNNVHTQEGLTAVFSEAATSACRHTTGK